MMRTAIIACAIASMVACRGDDEGTASDGGATPDMGSTTPDGGMAAGSCPMGQGTAFTICELKNDGNPRQPPLGDPIEVENVVVTTSPFSITRTATSGINGFYVQDQMSTEILAGRYSGIVVTYNPEMMTPPGRGQVVNITGTFRDFAQMGATLRQKQVQLASFQANGTAMVTPRMIADPASIATGGMDAVAYEGVVVEVSNVEATVVRDVPGAGGNSIFGAFQVTGGLIVRNVLSNVSAIAGEQFNRLAGVLSIGTAPFDSELFALNPRDPTDVESSVMAVRTIVDLQDPMAPGRPTICTQRGGNDTRSGVCPRVSFTNVVITAVEPVQNGRASMWVQDDSVGDGRFSGVRIFSALIQGMGTPTVGDRVDVEGIAVLFFDGLQVADATATLIANGAAPTPVVVPSTNLPGTPTLMGGEVVSPYEGVLVRINNVSVTNRCIESNGDRGYFEVTGGVIVGNEFDYAYNGGAPMNTSNPGPCSDMPRPNDMRMVGDTFQSISGIMDYSFNQFRLNPRGDADLVR